MPLSAQIDTNGEWQDVVTRLYACFREIFYAVPRRLVCGRLLVIDGRCVDDDKEEGFWHVVSRDVAGARIPDPDRARRMPWIADMLDGTAPGLSRWRYTEGSGKVRQYYWLEQESYVLILEEERRVTALVTAFFVDKTWAEEDLARKREKGTPF